MADWKEFTVLTRDLAGLSKPAVCPGCSRNAGTPVEILQYRFMPASGEMIAFGLIGLLAKCLFWGSDSDTIVTIPICKRCYANWQLCRTLEILTRIGGIFLTLLLILALSSKETGFSESDSPILLLAIVPFVVLALVAFFFRDMADKSKGIVLINRGDFRTRFSVKNNTWLDLFQKQNENVLIDGKTGQNDVDKKINT